jgi:large subunit ribosomal protein L31
MKSDIHPSYEKAVVTCACGNSFETRSTKKEIHLEICSSCHPFYTGRQKLVDSAGMVDKFQRRMQKTKQAQEAREKGKKKRKEY